MNKSKHVFDFAHVSTKGWTLDNIIERGTNFRQIPTIDVAKLKIHEIEQLVQKHESSGMPLLMTGFHRRPSWDSRIFSPEWLKEVMGDSRISVRNVYNRKDQESSITEYLEYAKSAKVNASIDEGERLYAKDAPFPEGWHNWMLTNLPLYLLPFGIGDINTYLSPENRVETLMTYLGIGDTYTPAHKDSCASVGQNLMVHTARDASSFWFLTSRDDSYKASMYWRTLGQELDHESHVATVEELARADFPIYVCEQRLGSFVIVPPQSCHQVLNSGGLTMKLSWSRMIPQSFSRSIIQELPIYQRVCRPEIYRVRATIMAVITHCSNELATPSGKGNEVLETYSSLLKEFLPLYHRMLVENYDMGWKTYPIRNFEGDSCDCCGADIWQSAMVCGTCTPPPAPGTNDIRSAIIICGPCYVDGRSCPCRIMQPSQAFSFDELLQTANKAISLLQNQEQSLKSLSEKDIASSVYPPFFQVANFLHQYRLSTKFPQQRICNIYRGRQKKLSAIEKGLVLGVHHIPAEGGMTCNGCHTRACWYHILEKYNTHIMSIINLSDAYKALQRGETPAFKQNSIYSDAWHDLHSGGITITNGEIPFDNPWADWLPRLAQDFGSFRSINESVLLGWYDDIIISKHDQNSLKMAIVDPSIALDSQISSQATSIPPVFYSSLKRKASTNGISSGRPHKKRHTSWREDSTDLSSPDEISISHSHDYEGSSTDEISMSFRSKDHANHRAKGSYGQLPFPPNSPATVVKSSSPSKKLPASSMLILQRARADIVSNRTPREISMERQMNQLKMEVELLKAENEAEKIRTAAAEQRMQDEMTRLWDTVKALQALPPTNRKRAGLP